MSNTWNLPIDSDILTNQAVRHWQVSPWDYENCMAESAQTTPEPTDQGESHGGKRTRSRDERASSRGERALHVACVATSSRCGHVDELATEPFLLLHREHGTGYQRSWNCCDRRTHFDVNRKNFCFILSTSTKIRIDSVMRPRSSSRERNTSASVTVTVTVTW